MKKNKFGEIVLQETDLCDLIMQGTQLHLLSRVCADSDIDVDHIEQLLEQSNEIATWTRPQHDSITVEQFDQQRQAKWLMPPKYQDLDIAEHVLGLCTTPDQLQRAGQELLMFQEHNLFNLLRYMKYLVDTMTSHDVIWGVGRGSSVSSYVLYLLGVHKIDSMFYDLDPGEFLR
jgi:DNA polymerase III alpha subunit